MQSIIFTKEQVNKTLPLVKNITNDIMKTWNIIIESRAKCEKLEIQMKKYKSLDDKSASDLAEYKDGLNVYIDRINRYIKEIEALGAFVEEFRRGIVNFPTIVYDRKAFICIRPLEEDEATYFHELDETFADRQELPSAEHRLTD